jgi:outer membrane protein assembly factor BamD (BamD/ComL family)
MAVNCERGRNGTAKGLARLALLLPVSASLCASAGCVWDNWHVLPVAPPPPGAADTMVLRGDRLEAEAPPAEGTAAADLAGAHELYRRGDFAAAEKYFHRIADNTKNTPQVAEEARYYEADCLRRQEKFPKAADTYHKLLIDFPSGVHREQAVRQMFDISQYWLKDTDEEIKENREKKEGKRWFVAPSAPVHFEKKKPFFDEEGRALEILEQVKYNDMNGPLADKALFLAGSVRFFREDYREADNYFSQLVEMHPNSPLASKAVELAIISKNMSTGGSSYDGRKCAEARQLVYAAVRNYPDLAAQKTEFLQRQLTGINLQQADKDYKIAEFYRRTGHPGSAYFYYEIVRRRYPGTPYFDKATEHMLALRAKLEKEQASAPAAAAPTPAAPAAPAPPPGPKPEAAPMPRKLSGPPADQQEETAPAPRILPPTIK